MLKLESRPIPGKPWEYMFYADLQVPEEGQKLQQALDKMASTCPFYRQLGVYRAALPLDFPSPLGLGMPRLAAAQPHP